MLSVDFDRNARVLRVTISGIFSSEDLEEIDRIAIEFAAREGQVRSILDYTDVEAFAVPESRLAQRARQPPIMQDQRVIVASRIVRGEHARAYGRHQREAGNTEATIVDTLAEAYAMLRLKKPRFEPVEC